MQFIDQLMVSIGLDTSGLKKGVNETDAALKKVKESGVKHASALEEGGKKAADAIGAITRQALTLFAVLMGGKALKTFTEDLMRSDSALGRFASRLDVAPQAISEYSQAIDRMGGNGQAAAQSMQSLTDSLIDLQQTGTSSITEWYYRLSAASGVVFDRNKGIQQQFLDISEALHRLSASNPALANWYGKKLGLDQDTIDFLRAGPGYVQSQLNRSSPWVPTPDELRKVHELQDSWREIQNAATEFGRTIVADIAPALSSMFASFDGFLKNNKGTIDKYIVIPFRLVGAALETNYELAKSMYGILKEIGEIPWIKALVNMAGSAIGSAANSIDRFFESLPDEEHDKSLGHLDSTVRRGYERFKKALSPDEGAGSSSENGSSNNYGWNGPTSGHLTAEQGAALLRSQGATPEEAAFIGAHMGGESRGNPRAHNFTYPDKSYGLWQINMIGGMGEQRRRLWGLKSNEDLYDPATNARAAIHLYREWRRRGGTNPWAGSNRFMTAEYSARVAKAAREWKPQDTYSPPLMGFGSGAAGAPAHGLVGLRAVASAQNSANDNRVTNNSSASVNVNGPITVKAGGDADKIANELHAAIQRSAYANMANYGLK